MYIVYDANVAPSFQWSMCTTMSLLGLAWGVSQDEEVACLLYLNFAWLKLHNFACLEMIYTAHINTAHKYMISSCALLESILCDFFHGKLKSKRIDKSLDFKRSAGTSSLTLSKSHNTIFWNAIRAGNWILYIKLFQEFSGVLMRHLMHCKFQFAL